MLLRILTFISFTFILSSHSGCSSKKLHQLVVKGGVYDSESQTPIKNAKIKVEVSNPDQIMELYTNEKGEYHFSDSGVSVLLEDFISEEDLQSSSRRVQVKINHPEFLEDFFEEEFKTSPVEPVELDVGAFYLIPKDKEILDTSSQKEN